MYCQANNLKAKEKMDFNRTLKDIQIVYKHSGSKNYYKVSKELLAEIANKNKWICDLDEYEDEIKDEDEEENEYKQENIELKKQIEMLKKQLETITIKDILERDNKKIKLLNNTLKIDNKQINFELPIENNVITYDDEFDFEI